MKKKHSISSIVAAVALVALCVPMPAFSQMKDMSHKDGHGQIMEMDKMDKMGDMMGMCIDHADKMGLTDDQIAKAAPAHREMQKKHARYNADVKIAEIELMEIMDVKNFDLEKAGAAVKKIADIKTAHQLEMLGGMKEMRTMLTDEQFKKMKKMMSMNMDSNPPAKKMHKKHMKTK